METVNKNFKAMCILLAMLVNTIVISQITPKKLNEYKAQLGDYNYTGFSGTSFILGNDAQKITTEFTAFKGYTYRLLFYSESSDMSVTIRIYDRNPFEQGCRKVFDSSDLMDQRSLVFEPPYNRTYYIEYVISGVTKGVGKKRNVIMLVGSKIKPPGEDILFTTK